MVHNDVNKGTTPYVLVSMVFYSKLVTAIKVLIISDKYFQFSSYYAPRLLCTGTCFCSCFNNWTKVCSCRNWMYTSFHVLPVQSLEKTPYWTLKKNTTTTSPYFFKMINSSEQRMQYLSTYRSFDDCNLASCMHNCS